MEEREHRGRGAVFLTFTAALAQGLAFLYRVALSRLAGAQVMGLYQILMPAYAVLLSLTVSGLTAACANQTSHCLAFRDWAGVALLRRCCLGLLLLGVGVLALLVVPLSDPISVYLLGDARTRLGLMFLLPCALLTGVENIQKNIFYSADRFRPPALAELAEQGVRACAVLGLLLLFPGESAERTLALIVMGMALCEVTSAVTMTLLCRLCFPGKVRGGAEERLDMVRKICAYALPVGATALLGNLMGAANAALIPQKLVEGGMEREAAVAQLGIVCGMTLPMLSLPTVFLGALNLIFLPELTRAYARGDRTGVCALGRRLLEKVTAVLFPALAVMAVLGGDLARLLFREPAAGEHLTVLCLATLFSGIQGTLAAILNNVGGQRDAALLCLLCDGVQLCFVFAIALPGVGMSAFLCGTLVSAALGMVLCARQVRRAVGLSFPFFPCALAPGLSAALAGLTGRLLLQTLRGTSLPFPVTGAAVLCYLLLVYLAAMQAQGLLRPKYRKTIKNN